MTIGIVSLATPTVAQDIEPISPEFAARQDMTLARVLHGSRAVFYHGEEIEGCPGPTAKCQRRAFVVAGDVVLIGEVRGSLVEAFYTDAGGRPTHGWLARSALTPISPPQPTSLSWIGHWKYDEADIDISAGKRPGNIKAEGRALWGMHDPDRVKRGAVNDGEFAGEATLTGDHIQFIDTDYEGCRVSMRLIGPYLVAADNLGCGGLNVSFSGIYRRTSAKPGQ